MPEGKIDEAFGAARAAGAGAWGPFDRARTELLYGTRLANSGRTEDARSVLNGALTTFEDLGARFWVGRAREGIAAAGGEPRPPRVPLRERLTPQELEVSPATAQGASPVEIADQLFLGPRTVRLQLASAAIKLGLESAAGLAEALQEERREAVAVPQ